MRAVHVGVAGILRHGPVELFLGQSQIALVQVGHAQLHVVVGGVALLLGTSFVLAAPGKGEHRGTHEQDRSHPNQSRCHG